MKTLLDKTMPGRGRKHKAGAQPAELVPMRPELVDVSVVLCTKDRVGHVARALSQYALQNFEGSRELVLVDSGMEPVPNEIWEYAKANGQYLRAGPEVPLGEAMNAGCAAARGAILQKWDDDDLYAPGFLTASVRALSESGAMASLWGEFLVIVGGTTRLASGGIQAGGTLAIQRKAWEKVPWRPVAARVDAGMIEDLAAEYGELAYTVVRGCPELYTWIRHGGNMSQTLATSWAGHPISVGLDAALDTLPKWKGGSV